MRVRTTRATIEKLIELLDGFDSNTETFLNELPTPEKYAILAVAIKIRGCDDFEEAYGYATQVPAQDLTKYIMAYPSVGEPWLKDYLKDAMSGVTRHGWSYIEKMWSDIPDNEGDEDEEIK